ncbi:tetratricopeptide repeat protein [Massilia sp. YIM B04103]|uniref:tetratricopeptide repeat protein n=1 Tax=Massilia sp. YIM B04103 TaxID=2963106 RepID=UPI00210ED022|nr:tetratricopeptide repeat protein [Massilia sp. YIM B04103]
MPILGLGLHVLVALFFAVHAIRTRQQMYWLLILFSFPLLGSIVYFFGIYMPNSRLEHGARKMVTAAAKSLDPTRELREARAAFDFTPTAQNQMRLASALLEAGQAQEAASVYETCLQGAFSSDLDIRLGAARANLASGHAAQAIGHLEQIRRSDINFRAEQVSLTLAQALSESGRKDEARAEFDAAVTRFGSFDARAEYAIWAASEGETSLANRLQAELQHIMDHWNRHTRDMNMPLIRRMNAAYDKLKR